MHVIYTAYGFWLPNDPRGSWSAREGSSFGRFRCGSTKPEKFPRRDDLAIAQHPRPVQQIVGHLKSRATMLLNELDIHPLREFRRADGSIPKPWVEGCWKVFLDSHADIVRTIDYVEKNPIREGFKPQRRKFVTHYRS